METILYRYYDQSFGEGWDRTTQVFLEEYKITRETKCFYFIGNFLGDNKEKRVSKSGLRRYAYPDMESALRSFRARKRMQVKILTIKLDDARRALATLEIPTTDNRYFTC